MRRGALTSLAAAATAGLLLTGCGGGASASGGEPELTVGGAYIPAPPTADLAAGYFVVTNSGGADTLVSATSELAGTVTLHSTEGGRMREEKSFPVPADGTLDFARGGNHLMFEDLTRKPVQGDTVTLELRFEKSGVHTVEVPVREATYNPANDKSSTSSHAPSSHASPSQPSAPADHH
ncbi:copper chaperone PCu(A)C [Streptomyces uncialis]|uniref:copper chaperone PCu(A)C n=1 Tax=Streptomyces uncialis TaxID=1048205 RepID=UPI002E2ECA5B|nr:copper chaperone PCu(A)C [Streptomyces uncialis]